jgi:alkanesulfonate monooxygenase SsuD/methylene tetrahydromethanopterin reductase-like flavin-dependent oxidoreductase (luciferase family)
MEPKPIQKPHLPLWIGAREPVGLKRAVRYGDGWIGAGSSSSADFVKQVGEIRRLLDETRRDPATFAISKRVYVAINHDRDRAERRLREWFAVRYKNSDMAARVSIWGSAKECVDKLGYLVEAGAKHLLLNPVFDEMEHLEALATDVLPHL